MSLDSIKKMLNLYKEKNSNSEPVEKNNDIYDVLKILDKYKNNDDIKKIYKTKVDYERDGNRISLIFNVNKFKRMNSFDYLLDSEYIKDMFKEIDSLDINNTFKKRIRDKRNYKLSTYGDMAMFKTPFFIVR